MKARLTRFPKGLLWSALLFGLLTGCGNPNQEKIDNAPLISKRFTDDLGREVVLKRAPERVVSLAPNITEMIFAIGGQDQLAARSHACDFPPEVYDYPEVVTFPEFDLPTVASHNPDLVLATNEIHNEKIIGFFDKYKIPLHFQSYKGLSDIYRNIEVLGAMLQLEENAQALSDSLQRLVKTIADSTAGQVRYKTMLVLSVKPLIVAGGNSYMHEVIETAGGQNAFGDKDSRYPPVTPEAVIKAAPEYIILPTSNEQMYSELIAEYPAFHTTLPAALNNRVYIVPPDLFVRAGPRILEGIAQLTRILHPRIDVTELL